MVCRYVNPERRIHVYERCSQFSILQRLPTAYVGIAHAQALNTGAVPSG